MSRVRNTELPERDPGVPGTVGFGGLLRRHRRARGLTQSELAEQAGISTRSVSDLERGLTRTPYRDTVNRLARVLELAGSERSEFEVTARGGDPSASASGAPAPVNSGGGVDSVDGMVQAARRFFRPAGSAFHVSGRAWVYGIVLLVLISALLAIAVVVPSLGSSKVVGGDFTFETSWALPPAEKVQSDHPLILALGSFGDLYELDRTTERISRFSKNGQLLDTWGTPGDAVGQFHQAGGLAIGTNGDVYVADTGNNRVQMFTPTGRPLSAWGKKGQKFGQMLEPASLAIDIQGYVYVADTGNSRIDVFTASGKPVTNWDRGGWSGERIQAPSAMAIDTYGTIWVASTSGNSIQAFAPNGTRTSIWDTSDFFHHSLVSPTAINVDGAGNVYVLDSAGRRIQKFARTGERIAEWRPPWDPPRFGRSVAAAGFTVAENGELYVESASTGTIEQVSPRGAAIFNVRGAVYRYGAPVPRDVAVDRQGHVHVLDAANNRILIFDGSGHWERTQEAVDSRINPLLGQVGGIAVDDRNNTFFTDYSGSHVVEIADGGAIVNPWERTTVPTALNLPRGIAVDSGGQVLVTDQGKGRVEMFSAQGHFSRFWPLPSAPVIPPYPAGIAADTHQHAFVTDSLGDRICQFIEPKPDVYCWRTPRDHALHAPLSIAVSPNGTKIYVADTGRGLVEERALSGRLIRAARLPRTSRDQQPRPSGLSIDAVHHALYVADPGIRRVDVFATGT